MVKKYFKAIRIKNLVLLGLIFWGLMLHNYSENFSFKLDHLLLFISIIITTASGYLINNYYDLVSDKINNKNIKDLSQTFYGNCYLLHLLSSLLILFISDLSPGWLNLVIISHVLVFLYSLKLQHLPIIGNLVVALLCSIVLIIPYWLTGEFWELENFNLSENLNQIFVIFCFLLTIKREIVKDIEDIHGDLKTGSYTLPIVTGQKFSKVILGLLVLISIGFLITCVLGSILNIQNIFFFITMISLLVTFLYKTYLSFEKSDFKTLSNLLKINFLAAGIWLYILL
ncbi:UbiA family prenyltransferase [Flavobacteriales bacterium]|nr:UbiA family prenyltransferase [Flavobacteriales bacterium]